MPSAVLDELRPPLVPDEALLEARARAPSCEPEILVRT